MAQPAVEDANTVGLKRSFATLCRDLAGIAAGKPGNLNSRAVKSSMADSEKASMNIDAFLGLYGVSVEFCGY